MTDEEISRIAIAIRKAEYAWATRRVPKDVHPPDPMFMPEMPSRDPVWAWPTNRTHYEQMARGAVAEIDAITKERELTQRKESQ